MLLLAVVLMAGGKGTRLDIFTKILPKPLIPVGEKPIIEHVIDKFRAHGFNKFVISLNYKAELIKTYFSEHHPGYHIEFIEEKKMLGTAGALSLCKQLLDDTFIVSNSDVLFDGNLDHLVQFHHASQNDATIMGTVRNVKIPYGVLKSNGGNLESIEEKPEYNFIINSGIYVLEPQIINLIPKGHSIDMTDLLVLAKNQGMKVQVCPMTSQWFDIGEWNEYKRAIDHMTSLGAVN